MIAKTVHRLLAAAIVFGVCLTSNTLMAQGLLIHRDHDGPRMRLPRPHFHPQPRPTQSYKISELKLGINLKDQVGRVQVSQTFVNTGSRQMEVCFVFPLPHDGAVESMTLEVDGKELEAKLLDAKEARSIYEGYIRRNQDPALLEWIGTGMFKTSVFPVPRGAARTVTLKYTQLCRKTFGLTELLLPLSTAKYTSTPVETVDIRVTVQSNTNIKNVYSPTHSVEIKRPSKEVAVAHYVGINEIPTSDFRLLYDIGKKKIGASVLSYRPEKKKDGYFLMLVSPDIQAENETPQRKTVVFVMDRSGSMSGKKIEQAKESLRFVLNNLNDGDLFNIIAYDSTIESFQPELQRYNEESRTEAMGFVEGIYSGGSTNIDGALRTALAQLTDDEQPSYVIFLTDGLPTTGETNESKIVGNSTAGNKVRARVFCMGVGFDVNSRLLDKLARKNYGRSEYVRPNEDLEEHLSRLYQRIGAPALTDISIRFELDEYPSEKGKLVNRVYPRDAYDLFAGDQLVVAGRYKSAGDAKVIVTGTVNGVPQRFDFPAKFVKHSKDESFAFVEKLWAIRRVGEIIDEIDLHGKNQELVNELIELSRRHGILTPYTSFLADETTRLHDLAGLRAEADVQLEALAETSGRSAFYQRVAKSNLQRAAQPATSQPAADAFRRDGGGGVLPGYFAARADRRARSQRPGQMEEAGDRGGEAVVQTIGRKTFYKRGDRWVDSTLTAEQEKNVRRIERFSDEYFQLIKEHGKDVAKYLALDGDIVLLIGDEALELTN